LPLAVAREQPSSGEDVLSHHEIAPGLRLFMLLTVPREGEATLAPLDPATPPRRALIRL